MEPYISSFDTSKPISELIYQYGDKKSKDGFILGFVTGLSVATIYCLLTRKKQ